MIDKTINLNMGDYVTIKYRSFHSELKIYYNGGGFGDENPSFDLDKSDLVLDKEDWLDFTIKTCFYINKTVNNDYNSEFRVGYQGKNIEGDFVNKYSHITKEQLEKYSGKLQTLIDNL